MEGYQIGTYRIERKLGEGGMGVVWVGVDIRLGRRAAIKQLLPEMSTQRDIVERFFNEAKAAASINHPGIVEIYDVGWHTDGSAFFAMKLLEGDSLARRLRSTGPMPAQLAATIARQVSAALAAAHARGIVHRDLKPDNIVLVADEEVSIGERATVLDFGIAKLFGERPLSAKTRTGSVMGTPYYMSPEQCRGAGEVDHRTDLYALGCIVFEMLTGRPPFVAEGAGEILGMHQFVEAPTVRSLRPDISPDLEAVVMRALAKRPEQRQQTMSELQAALQPFATARSLEHPAQRPATPQPFTSQPPQPSTLSAGRGEVAAVTAPTRNRRGLVLAVGGATVVAAGVMIAILASGGSKDSKDSKDPTPVAAGAADVAPAPAKVEPAVPAKVEPAPAAPRPASASADTLLAAARSAMTEEKWDEAANAAAKALELAPDNKEARAVSDQAKLELASQREYDSFAEAVKNRKYERAAASFEKIPADSVYKNKARTQYDAMHDGFLTATKSKAQALARAKQCKELARLASDAGKVFPDARTVVQAVPCKEAQVAVAGGEPAPPPPPPPADGKSATDLADEALSAAKMSMWGRALSLSEQALRARPDATTKQSAIKTAALSACNLKNAAKAKQYFPQLPPSIQSMMRQRCLANGVELD